MAMEFVVAAANLRSLCYHIPTQSFFEAKGMAGNIIHAIATTNAIISGLIVVEALKLIASGGDPTTCRATFLRQDLSNRKLVTPTMLEPPNPKCSACSANDLHVRIDTKTTTLADFVNKVLKGKLGLSEPTLIYGGFFYEEGENLEDVEINAIHLPKKLVDLPSGGMTHNVVLEVGDQQRELKFKLHVMVSHQDVWDETLHPERFVVEGEVPPETAPEAAAADGTKAEENGLAVDVFRRRGPATIEDDDGVLMLVDSEDEGPSVVRKKRKLEDGGDDDSDVDAAKRAKTMENGGDDDDNDVIELLD